MTLMERGNDTGSRRDSQVRRAPNSSGLYDVLDLILDKGIVIDAFVRVSLVGIELLTVDLRVVVASVDTYLRYAEGVERLQLYDRSGAKRLPDMVGKASKGKAINKQVDKVTDAITGKGDGEEEEEGAEHEGLAGTIGRGVRSVGGALANMVSGGGDDNDDEDEGSEEEERDLHEERAARAKKPSRSSSGKSHGRSHSKK